jgi:hypothetical protein
MSASWTIEIVRLVWSKGKDNQRSHPDSTKFIDFQNPVRCVEVEDVAKYMQP